MAAGHDVDVQVGHALADDVVDGDKCAVGARRLLHGRRQSLCQGEEQPYLRHGQIGKGRDVIAGDEQHVTWEERAAIEEGDAGGIVENDVGGRRAARDRTKWARSPRSRPGLIRLSGNVEDHAAPYASP